MTFGVLYYLNKVISIICVHVKGLVAISLYKEAYPPVSAITLADDDVVSLNARKLAVLDDVCDDVCEERNKTMLLEFG